ncbi:unnamed protein product [Brachionus calyciflorus]|uniref:V-SNARE coiled-coil homology domain-containing protein n=1 Tax=Brachionus calyciflorus TaxID=104777 RepID=A0A813NLD9_9BILA|nr:unnamed protein product [Brachionus calyciflorus]
MSELEKTALLYSDEEDDNILDINRNKSIGPDAKLQKLHNQVNDVIDGMKINIEKVAERGQNLDILNDRSEQLSTSGDLFSKRARNMRKHMWLRTCRARMYLGITIGFIIVLIIFFFYRAFTAS